MFFYIVKKSWWRDRWNVFEIGHTLDDVTWIASFESEKSAHAWAEAKT